MSKAFEILSAALKEAIDDVQNPVLPRKIVERKCPRFKRFTRTLKRTRKSVAC